jgi:hypothetical protein
MWMNGKKSTRYFLRYFKYTETPALGHEWVNPPPPPPPLSIPETIHHTLKWSWAILYLHFSLDQLH